MAHLNGHRLGILVPCHKIFTYVLLEQLHSLKTQFIQMKQQEMHW